ncbi:MAG: CBS domain containing-hemolysin-like protein [Pirellulaceae bacterium]|jgi:CBS domain containing-hemolysin-like protein
MNNDLDNMIRQALGSEHAEIYDQFAEPSLSEMVVDSFRGRTRWLVALTFVSIAVFTILAGVSAYQLYCATEVKQLILWAVAVVFCLIAVSIMKIWYWMELNKHAIMREFKRVELQLASAVNRRPTKSE